MIIATDSNVAATSFVVFSQPGESATAILAVADVGFAASKVNLREQMS